MNCVQPKQVDTEILRIEDALAAAADVERERIERAVEENICAILEDVIRAPVSVKTPACYKFSSDPDDPEAILFTLLRFEAAIYA